MQFVPGYQNLDNSVFGEISPPPHHSSLPSSTWLHVPPMHMPWGTPLSDQPSIVRFTAESTAAAEAAASSTLAGIQNEIYNSNAFQCKRKIETEVEIRPPKKHITEEKMAAHMSQLSISGDYSPSIHAETISEEKPTTSTATEDTILGRRLILSDELRALQSEPILPQSLMSKLEKPSMALVLWQPPAGNLGEQLRSAARLNASHSAEERLRQQQLQQQQQQQQQLDSNDNNNTPAAVDLNAFTSQQGQLIPDDNSEMEL